MIRIIILILILAFVCAVFAIHSYMKENEADEEVIDNMIKNKVIDKVAKGKE